MSIASLKKKEAWQHDIDRRSMDCRVAHTDRHYLCIISDEEHTETVSVSLNSGGFAKDVHAIMSLMDDIFPLCEVNKIRQERSFIRFSYSKNKRKHTKGGI
jgi:hypothetical protein